MLANILSLILTIAALLFSHPSLAQQYAGDVIPNTLPLVPGAEIAFFRINDPSGKNKNLTLINYYTHQLSGQRVVDSNLKRAVIIIHGLNRDPGTYASNMMSALAQLTTDANVNRSSVAIMAPYFANGDDKNYGYPWTDGLKAGRGSTSNALVWKGSQWSAGGNNQYPYTSTTTSSYTVLDQLIAYFSDASRFPKMTQIVIAGHSLGAQTVQRYAALGQPGASRVPVTYWIGNPNSYVWLSADRPLSTAGCPTYDDYREGYNAFADYPMTYGLSLVNSGRVSILANFQSKQVAYGRGTQDLGDDSSSCAPGTTGANRNERFFNFIKAFPPSCADPSGNNCDTVDFVNTGHDGGAMFASDAGKARLFTDNFYGDGKKAFDFGYPRQQLGDDPYPNPQLNETAAGVNNNTYAGNMTYQGCFSDQDPRTLANLTYDSNTNTIEQCTAACASGGNTIAGLEYGSQCFCGKSLTYKAIQVIDSSCSMPCPGNSSEICGGGNRLSLFSNGRPQVQAQPGTPETVGNAPFYYVSCYSEATSGRALGGIATSGNFMTLDYCANFCSSYKYFGVEFGSECYCGNSFGTGATRTNDNECNMLCANDGTEFCGAGNRLTVYQNPNWSGSLSSTTTLGQTSTSTSTSTAQGSVSTSTAVSCPGSDGVVVAASNGKNFTIECGIDHQGGDLTSLSVNSFYDCIDACAKNAQCVDVALSGSSCYLKSSIGAAVQNGVWGAKLISTASTASSTGVGSTTTSSSALPTSTGPAASVSTGVGNFAFVGCYSEVGGRALQGKSTSGSMTNQLCATFCAGFQFFATEYANECYCGNSLVAGSAPVTDGRCNMACAADASQICGGPNGLSLYNVTAASVSSTSSALTMSSTLSSPVSSSSSLPLSPGSSASGSSSTLSSSTSSSTSTALISTVSSSTLSIVTSSSTSSRVSTTSSSSTTSSATVKPTLPSGFSALGCYVDNNPARALPRSNGTSFTQTTQQCALNCRDQGYKYSGTEYGQECWCGNDAPTTSAPPTDCKNHCSGDKSLTCGGGNRLSIVEDTTFKQRFFATPSYSTWNLMGCYIDGSAERLLKNAVSLSAFGGGNNATIANCMSACQAKGYKFCGEEYYSECYGGNVEPDLTLLAKGVDPLKAGCNFPCKGNPNEACGGSSKILVYINNGTAA